jgi:hypothetical protein
VKETTMRDDLVAIYRAPTIDDAQRLADKLQQAGIESFVDSTDAPMYGATQGPAARIVRVRRVQTGAARDVMKRYSFHFHPELPQEEMIYEQTGLELPIPDRPSDDSPNEPEGEGTERMDADPPGAASVELVDMILDTGQERDISAEEIDRYDGDRSVEQAPEMEREEIEEQLIDDLDVERDLSEHDLSTPSANLKGEEEREERERRGL